MLCLSHSTFVSLCLVDSFFLYDLLTFCTLLFCQQLVAGGNVVPSVSGPQSVLLKNYLFRQAIKMGTAIVCVPVRVCVQHSNVSQLKAMIVKLLANWILQHDASSCTGYTATVAPISVHFHSPSLVAPPPSSASW